MAQKKTYIYHMLIGNDDKTEVDEYMLARNAGVAITFCQDKYKEQKYNSYKAIKVGLSHTLQETQFIDPSEAMKLRNSIASQSDKYAERIDEAPKFITKEEAGELGL